MTFTCDRAENHSADRRRPAEVYKARKSGLVCFCWDFFYTQRFSASGKAQDKYWCEVGTICVSAMTPHLSLIFAGQVSIEESFKDVDEEGRTSVRLYPKARQATK